MIGEKSAADTPYHRAVSAHEDFKGYVVMPLDETSEELLVGHRLSSEQVWPRKTTKKAVHGLHRFPAPSVADFTSLHEYFPVESYKLQFLRNSNVENA